MDGKVSYLSIQLDESLDLSLQVGHFSLADLIISLNVLSILLKAGQLGTLIKNMLIESLNIERDGVHVLV